MEKLGLIAGSGELPLRVLEYCKNENKDLYCVLIKGFADFSKYSLFKNISISFGEVGKAINFFHKHGVKNVVFAGAVKKPRFGFMKLDFKGLLLLKQILKNSILGDNTVIETIISFLKKYDIEVLEIDSILKDIKFSAGDNSLYIANEYMENIEYGRQILECLSKFDIGQSVVIQQKNVIGIEAVEGTKNLIERCAAIKYSRGQKPILVKIKKVGQSRKIDLPTIGPDTIEQIQRADFAGLAIDCKNCLVISPQKVLDLANKYGLFIYGF